MWNVWDTAEYEYEIWQPQLTNSRLAADAEAPLPTQRSQHPLSKEYPLNHNIKASII